MYVTPISLFCFFFMVASFAVAALECINGSIAHSRHDTRMCVVHSMLAIVLIGLAIVSFYWAIVAPFM